MITNVYYGNLGNGDFVEYARDKNLETGEERILERHELINPNRVEVGDEDAYKVNLVSDRIFYERNIRTDK